LKLIAGTAVISLPIGILTGTYLAEYSKRGRFTCAVEYSIEILNGTPSIVFALFGLSAIVTILGLGISLLAGCITLAFMILPVIIKTTEDALMNVPREVREASYALGASKRHTTFMVVLPAALGGILTGAILGLGRAAGETAPIMFTAAVLMQYKVGWGVFDPVMALPYHLYYLATEGAADPSMQYATALVLLVIVLSMFLLANVIRKRSNEKNRW
jgi:phosphate transport system permease protein